MPESVASPPTPRRWLLPVIIAMASTIGGGVVGAVVVSSGDDGPTRQETVADRGASVMPFDLSATTHVFDATGDGGIQTVIVDDPTDRDQITLIRSHLREEVERFRVGDFGDPATIHGHDMPGLSVLEAKPEALEISYRELRAGAEVTYRSDDPSVIAALHDWFAAQLSDHGSDAHD
jgi:hypothetical protein